MTVDKLKALISYDPNMLALTDVTVLKLYGLACLSMFTVFSASGGKYATCA